MVQYDTVISPCVSICRLDKEGICIGCYRSIKEIRSWFEPSTTNDDRREILDNIEQRKKKLNGNASTVWTL